jgi:hypothetical protein
VLPELDSTFLTTTPLSPAGYPVWGLYYAGNKVGQAFQPDMAGVRLESLTYVVFFRAGVVLRSWGQWLLTLSTISCAAFTTIGSISSASGAG